MSTVSAGLPPARSVKPPARAGNGDRVRRRRGTDPVAVLILAGAVFAGVHSAHPARPPGGSHAAHLAHLAHAGAGTGQVPAATSPAAGTSTRAATAISFAKSKLGDPYGYGATGPDSYDCSSLVMAAWGAAGVSIPRTSEAQWAALPHVSTPQPGDLVFYTGSSIDAPPGHVTMYEGGGKMIEAYATGYPIRETALRPGAWGYARPGGA